MNMKISPSIMCADFFNLEKCIKEFEENNIELIHIDIMDGVFVPNYTLGTDFTKALKKSTNIPLDIHLMIEKPEDKLSWFEFGEGEYVSVHYESTPHIHRALTAIKSRGAKAMVAINPGTPFCMLTGLFEDIDAVLIMTVNPGFAGQKLIESTVSKIKELRDYLDNNGYSHIEIEVDGNISFENIGRIKNAGANIFVSGSSGVFHKGMTISEATEKLRNQLI